MSPGNEFRKTMHTYKVHWCSLLCKLPARRIDLTVWNEEEKAMKIIELTVSWEANNGLQQ